MTVDGFVVLVLIGFVVDIVIAVTLMRLIHDIEESLKYRIKDNHSAHRERLEKIEERMGALEEWSRLMNTAVYQGAKEHLEHIEYYIGKHEVKHESNF